MYEVPEDDKVVFVRFISALSLAPGTGGGGHVVVFGDHTSTE